MRPRLASLLVVAVVSGSAPALATSAMPPGCAPTAELAAAIVHRTGRVADIDRAGATVHVPLVHPFVRSRLLRAGPIWCDAVSGFNAAAAPHLDPLKTAQTFARSAAAPYFDGVTVREAALDRNGAVRLTTHARTNGIVADWSVRVDALGVRDATWTAKDLGVPPMIMAWEGVTALPGLSVSYRRRPDGALVASRQPWPEDGPPSARVFTSISLSDGFTIDIRRANTGGGPSLEQDTGVVQADMVNVIRDATRENYEEFLRWGLHRGWEPADSGFVQVDDVTSLACLACVVRGRAFNIHISSAVLLYLRVFGYAYPDERDGLANVIGHEMFHNFQSVYYQPDGEDREMTTAFIEGTARFQETLHDYSAAATDQPASLVYHADGSGNSCNDYLLVEPTQDASVAGGPSTHLYDACYFWMSFYAEHGLAGLRGALEASFDRALEPDAPEFRFVVQDASAETFLGALQRFAATALTRRGLEWGPADGRGEVRDWGRHLAPWTPPVLHPGDSAQQRLVAGGMLGAEIVEAVTPRVLGGAVLTLVRDDGATSTVSSIASGTPVAAPGAGERVWVAAIRPTDAGADVRLIVDV